MHCYGSWLHKRRLHDQLAAATARNIHDMKQGFLRLQLLIDVNACKGMQGQILSKQPLAGGLFDASQRPLTDDFTHLLRSS